MAAYLVGHITIKDPEKWGTYVKGVAVSLEPFDADILFRGKRFNVLAGEHLHSNTVAIRFPNQEILQQWYHSENYQKLIPIRDAAADVVIVTYDES